ncbi:cytochrome d ubiquinol oxidase subunit II [Chachezhania sediminis]|uniref:cytochrome d ubiquinol oxidase subunit II n=1 Tax=Chachezhania sediminis TaxID=2599291 RepID=UPI00131D37D8|nr:cytochrome d ubiquinol oxidase subunit II [Chachezhania sediminis]
MEASTLALVWAGVIAFSILAYVILDGFDLGVGILFGTTRDKEMRHRMIGSIAPVWDGNETWLVVVGASLFAAFPAVYAVFLGAFYLPVLLMLIGLIFRGIAFEFREQGDEPGGLWDVGFFLGSVVVAFVQGAAVGALMRGLPVTDGQFSGTSLTWLHPFPVLTGVGLVIGYALLGAGWLRIKCPGALRIWATERIRWLGIALFVVLGAATVAAMTVDFSDGLRDTAARFNALHAVLLLIAVGALAGAIYSTRALRTWLPFALTALLFLAAFATLGTMMWPYMIPYQLTVAEAAAPEASLKFLVWAGVIALPLILAYTIAVYWIFARDTETSYHSGD